MQIPKIGTAPPCRQQNPFAFDGKVSDFPQLTPTRLKPAASGK